MNYDGHVERKTSSGCVQKLEELMLRSDNRICADCGAPDPKWASTNIGVFICLKCCEIHKSLGEHISKVLPLTLDEWSDDDVDSIVEVGGNSCVNSIYEEFFSEAKPNPNTSYEKRTKFIRSKYELQEFLKPSLRLAHSEGRHASSKSIMDTDNQFITRNLQKEQSQAERAEFLGALKVKVIKGTNLAIRDVLTSDPYVVLTFGQQVPLYLRFISCFPTSSTTACRKFLARYDAQKLIFLQRAQTAIKESNLNPIWNEEFKLLVPQQYGTLKLQVFDHDKLFVDDTMGEAEIDLQPTVTAAMTFEGADVLQNMQIGKWLRSSDNALINDSTINIVDGKIKQDIFLKLQNVESGEIQIELEWVPLEHAH